MFKSKELPSDMIILKLCQSRKKCPQTYQVWNFAKVERTALRLAYSEILPDSKELLLDISFLEKISMFWKLKVG